MDCGGGACRPSCLLRQWCSASQVQDGTEVAVKEVLAGDSVHSLLSILDVITVSPLGPRLARTAGPSAPGPVLCSDVGLVHCGRDPWQVRGGVQAGASDFGFMSWLF